MTPVSNGWALMPILIFLVLYLGNGIFFECIRPIEGEMGFYIISVGVAFGVALIAAFLQNRKLSFEEKIHLCAQGIGDDNITVMLFIFLLSGAFSGIAGKAGGALSTANMLLNIIPPKFAAAGLFIIACLISMAMGTMVTVLPGILKAVQAAQVMQAETVPETARTQQTVETQPVDQAIHQAIMKKLQKIHPETINQTMRMMLIPVIKRIQIPKMKIQIRIIQIPIQT